MTSLEELLAEEGFKKKARRKAGHKLPAAPRAASMPLYREHNSSFRNVDSGLRSGSTGSDVYSGRSEPLLWEKEQVRSTRFSDVRESERSNVRFQIQQWNEIEEIEGGGNGIQEIVVPRIRHPDESKVDRSYKQKYWNNLYDDQNLRSNASSSNERRARRGGDPKNKGSEPEPELDEDAIKAVVAILTSWVRRFIKDEKFRASIHHGCYTCLGILNGAQENHGAITTLREAIKTVERVVQRVQDPLDLRRASLKLGVITSLSSKELKDGHTSGIPNPHLSACAHLYLSVIYKLQRKDKVSGKHLLQVFCESPYQARTTLLPKLWEEIFLPYLSHLRAWYHKEAETISSMTKKMKLLDKVYNNTLDMGTYQFAVYYMKWVMEEAESPRLRPPAILVPSASFPRVHPEEVPSNRISCPHSSVSSQATVSKKLYESVFRRSKKMEEDNEMRSREEDEKDEEQLARSSASIERNDSISTYSHDAKENESILKKLALAAFHPAGEDQSFADDTVEKENTVELPVHNLLRINLTSTMNTGPESSDVPKDFICPLTGQLLEDPVTLKTGKTFERMAIKEWFDRGNNTCPATGQVLEHLSVPATNSVLKSMIDDWKSEYCKDLLLYATQITGNDIKQDSESKDETALFIIEQLLTGFSVKEQLENANHLISLGGLQFLLQRLESGNLEEKTQAVSLMLCCIKADGSCRNYLATNVSRPSILELLHSTQITARSNAVLLLIEILCLNRMGAIASFLSGLQTEDIVNTMHVLLVYLQCSQPEEGVLVAVLLLYLDLMAEPRRYSIYREEAVNSIVDSLECCLSDNNVVTNTHRALLMLGGHFISSGGKQILSDTWLLREAGFNVDYVDEINEMPVPEEESKEREEWLKNVTLVLLGNGKKSFLETLSKCIGSENPELVRACLIAAAWLSRALSLMSIAEIQLSALSALIPRLKDSLANGQQIEHRVLSCVSLLNFTKIPECRALLMASTNEICDCLKSLEDATWTAKHLYTAITAE